MKRRSLEVRLRLDVEVRFILLFLVREEVRQRFRIENLLHDLNLSVVVRVLIGSLIVVAEEQGLP